MKVKFNPITAKLDVVNDLATEIEIDDAGGYFSGGTVEQALQEIGAKDIWVEKAGDAMTGQLTNSVSILTPEVIGSISASASLTLTSTSHATKGSIKLGESLSIGADGSGVGLTSFGVITWPRGSKLYEQGGGGDPERFFFLANGDRWEVLSENGVSFIFAVHGTNSATADRIIAYRGICSSAYAAIAPLFLLFLRNSGILI